MTQTEEIRRLKEELERYDGLSVWKQNAMDLSEGEMFLFEGMLWTVVCTASPEDPFEESSIYAETHADSEGNYKSVKFTYAFNPEVKEIYSSSL